MKRSPSAFAASSVGFFGSLVCVVAACSSSSGSSATAGSDSGVAAEGGGGGSDGGDDGTTPGASDSGTSSGDSGVPSIPDAHGDAKGPGADGGLPAGWLYTSGAKIYESNGAGGAPWMGRGVNLDDIFLCGYDDTLWMTNPDQTLEAIVTGLMSGWKPTFVRVSLGMDSYPTVTSWLTDAAQYKTPMTNVIQAIGENPGVHVLVTLRSDASMIGQDTADGDAEATGLPSDSTTTPDKTTYPTGTDAVYQALVDTFANDGYVLFGLTNEPGGDKLSSATIAAAMSHAVGVIRDEEDKLGVPHHVVSVQGNGWTSDISTYAATPLPYDNVVYEVHGYPPTTASYTYANIPVILGEYGSLTDATSFYADVESKQIPNLAWDFEPYSDCSPDLLNVTTSSTTLTPSAWGQTVQAYLLAH
jgi:hypothetical protein